MDDGMGILSAIVVGAFLMFVVCVVWGLYLAQAQRSYTECISLQAPREECLKKYLLPEEK